MKKLESVVGAKYERYFENGSPNPAGDLLNAGIGIPARSMDWWDTRKMWSYPHYSIVLLLSDGRGFYLNENNFQCELAYGNLIITFPGQKQRYSPEKNQNWGELYAAFDGDLFQMAEKQNIINRSLPVWKLSRPERRIAQLQKRLLVPPATTPTETFRRAVSFLHYLTETLESASPLCGAFPAGDWFAHACQMITADLHHKRSWESISTELGMSYHTFRLYFKQRAGLSPSQYRSQQRFKTACEFLKNHSSKSCNEIAFILGFANAHHFSEQFKKHLGMSPHEYRQKHRNSSYAAAILD